MRFFSFFSSLGLLAIVMIGNSLDSTETTLRSAADFPVGVAVIPNRLNQTEYATVVAREFSSLTAENMMKPQYLWAGERTYDFSRSDSIINFAQAHNMQVHGHTLAWHNMQPRWLRESIDSYDSATLENMLRDYIQAVVTHYQGKVVSWDVVNEAIDPDGNGMRKSVYQQKLGDDYVARCHQYAREADPDVLLFYNDYDVAAKPEKLKAILAMVDDFQQRNIPIDGIGMQMHVGLDLSLENFQYAVDEISRRGLKIHLSEVDIKTNKQGKAKELTKEMAQAQQEKMKEIVQVFNSLPEDNKFAITFWGLRDNDSWLTNHTGSPQWPLLFDRDLQKKPMYQGFLDGLESARTSNN
uniref:Beta-xylanase n=1 Tax=Roseihalotalea indica TaxID=2867963 RepID=A0AA49JDM8_9BACT|nr:endo-1,4-beta-xylanase [Tunicatimonas sp. TK19036]